MSMPIRLASTSVLLAALAACTSAPTQSENAAPKADPTATAQATGAPPAKAAAATAADGAASTRNAAAQPRETAAKTGLAGAPTARSAYFAYDKYEVKDEFQTPLKDHAKYLAGQKNNKVLIQGNADERGSREYNLALGQKRADAVKRSLKLLGVREEQVESVSLGEDKPKASGHDEAAWAENRRADILYKGEY